LHFDLSIFDFFSTLRAGGTVVLVPEAVTKFPASWTKLLEEERVTAVFTVPYTLITMVEQGAMETRDLTALRWIMYGGEPYPASQLRQIMQALPHTQFTNVYGPAEAPSCTCYDIPRPLPDGDAPMPIGLVSLNSEGLIIDQDDTDCPPGTSGELCIRSSTLTRGYWNRPDLNEKAFLERDGLGPFPTVYFRTGDRVQEGEDGLLRFLGRMDRMVKTRGHRVELDEVEAALASHEDVTEVAAFTIPDERGSVTILAAATIRDGSDADRAALIAHMRKILPPYAVPRDLVVMDTLPHISSGKVDRRLLSATYTETH
jgi:acyl-coenzyme A synthetase/AMP-(fatty) acid ligase